MRWFSVKPRKPPPPRRLPPSCLHPCVSCEYFDEVHWLTGSQSLKDDVVGLKTDHFLACMAGEPNSGSCVRKGER